MADIKVFSKDGKEVKTINLNPEIFDAKIKTRLMELVVRLYANNKRTGNAHTKTRGEVRGGGKKPWRQKGTGRARVSSIRSPLWRGGGTVFGPRKRDIYNTISKKVKEAALRSALTKKLKDGKIIVVDDLNMNSGKTKDFAKVLSVLGIYGRKSLFVPAELGEMLKRATSNIETLSVKRVNDLNAYHVLRKNYLIIDENGIKALEARLLKKKEKTVA